MRDAKWFAGCVLGVAWMSVAAASNEVPLRGPASGPRVAYEAQGQAPQGKTREEVKRELAAARASGCMDVSDSQYPQPCPLPDGTRPVADAF